MMDISGIMWSVNQRMACKWLENAKLMRLPCLNNAHMVILVLNERTGFKLQSFICITVSNMWGEFHSNLIFSQCCNSYEYKYIFEKYFENLNKWKNFEMIDLNKIPHSLKNESYKIWKIFIWFEYLIQRILQNQISTTKKPF